MLIREPKGFDGLDQGQVDGSKMNFQEIFKKYKPERDSLIPLLQEIQKNQGYISRESLKEIAKYIDVSENDIYGVATFFAQFRFTKPGDHIINICLGTACHVRGGQRIYEDVCNYLGIKSGETTKDYKFSLLRVACFGSCALAPVVVIDNNVYGRMTPQMVRKLLDEI
ncbi:MAG: NADH-quinone oxidoreductase subunit NuoE [Candidatus Hydrogenedentota bacterium]